MLAKINAKFRQIEIDREKCSISKLALRILRKKPEQRTDLDLDSIVDELARQMWLEKLPEPVRISKEVFKNILRVVNVQTYRVPEVPIEEEGFPMDIMYIVVGGCMWVHPNDEENAKNKQRQAELGEKSDSSSGDLIGKKKLVPGDVIGEDFWQENNEWTNPFFPGNDGVMCLTIAREWYERALRPHTEASQKAKIALIKNCYPFANQDMGQCKALAALMTFRSYPCNTTIIRQGDIPNDIFFILKGHCCVIKDLMMPVEELRMLRKPLNPSLISYQSASTSPSDARRSRPLPPDYHPPPLISFRRRSWSPSPCIPCLLETYIRACVAAAPHRTLCRFDFCVCWGVAGLTTGSQEIYFGDPWLPLLLVFAPSSPLLVQPPCFKHITPTLHIPSSDNQPRQHLEVTASAASPGRPHSALHTSEMDPLPAAA